jgi:transcriptional regulator with GAF, ATPase, and Fis domain
MEIAQKGTIFFDEIGDLSLGLQQKLLRVLQEREFERLGSHEIHKVEARFIFATNHDLNADIKNGRFREDLFFRINVMPIKLPPLRDRKEDIPIFVNYFIGRFNRILGKAVTVLPDEVMSLLMEYDFPGNVRELSNLIERGLILSQSNIFNIESLSEVIQGSKGSPEVDFHITNFNFRESRRQMLDEFEKKFLTELLKINKGRVSLAAQRVGLERQSLYRLLKKHGIGLSQFNPKSHILGDNL